MLKSQIPVKFVEAFAALANASYIVTPVQVHPSAPGGTDGVTSLDLGFPPITDTPIASGGKPPRIQDFNGLMNQATGWLWWMAAGGGLIPWDSAFSAAVGGYPNGAVVLSATTPGAAYQSTVDNNVTNPDAAGAGWVPFSLFGTFTTGDVKLSYKTAPDVGWVPMNDGSIGSAASGATTRNNADTQPLFSLMYNNMVDAWAPIQTSGGAGTTRGAQGSAATAFGNNCRLVLPAALGRALFVSGAGAGLTARALGQTGGSETISGAQLPNITLLVNVFQSNARGPGPGDATGQTNAGTQSQVTNWPGTGQPKMSPFTSINAFAKL